MRILYVEDNANDAKLVERYIQTTSHQLVVVPTTEKAYELLADVQAFELIMVDILIDNQRSGYDLAQTLRQQGYPQPLVAITALTAPRDRAACAEAGFAAVLTKPYDITALADMLHQFS